MSTRRFGAARRPSWSRAQVGLALLVIGQTIALYLASAPYAVRNTLYACPLLCHGRTALLIPFVVALFSVAQFVIPSLIGALCKRWVAAITLAVLPWWLATLAHAGSALNPYIGLGTWFGRFDDPFWLRTSQAAGLLLSLLLFAALGLLGWLARQTVERS